MIKTAILIDGAFYRKRAYNLFGDLSPSERAKELENYCKRHIKEEKAGSMLYRECYTGFFTMIVLPLTRKFITLCQSDRLIYPKLMIINGRPTFLMNFATSVNLHYVLDG